MIAAGIPAGVLVCLAALACWAAATSRARRRRLWALDHRGLGPLGWKEPTMYTSNPPENPASNPAGNVHGQPAQPHHGGMLSPSYAYGLHQQQPAAYVTRRPIPWTWHLGQIALCFLTGGVWIFVYPFKWMARRRPVAVTRPEWR